MKTDRRVPNLVRAMYTWRIESSSHGRLYCIYVLYLGYIQGVSGGKENVLGGGSMDCFE